MPVTLVSMRNTPPACGYFLSAAASMPDPGRGDEQLVHIRPPENAGGDIRGRDAKLLQQNALRLPLRDARSAPHGDPQIAVRVGGHAVGPAERIFEMDDDARIGDLAGLDVVIEGLDLARRAYR